MRVLLIIIFVILGNIVYSNEISIFNVEPKNNIIIIDRSSKQFNSASTFLFKMMDDLLFSNNRLYSTNFKPYINKTSKEYSLLNQLLLIGLKDYNGLYNYSLSNNINFVYIPFSENSSNYKLSGFLVFDLKTYYYLMRSYYSSEINETLIAFNDYIKYSWLFKIFPDKSHRYPMGPSYFRVFADDLINYNVSDGTTYTFVDHINYYLSIVNLIYEKHLLIISNYNNISNKIFHDFISTIDEISNDLIKNNNILEVSRNKLNNYTLAENINDFECYYYLSVLKTDYKNNMDKLNKSLGYNKGYISTFYLTSEGGLPQDVEIKPNKRFFLSRIISNDNKLIPFSVWFFTGWYYNDKEQTIKNHYQDSNYQFYIDEYVNFDINQLLKSRKRDDAKEYLTYKNEAIISKGSGDNGFLNLIDAYFSDKDLKSSILKYLYKINTSEDISTPDKNTILNTYNFYSFMINYFLAMDGYSSADPLWEYVFSQYPKKKMFKQNMLSENVKKYISYLRNYTNN